MKILNLCQFPIRYRVAGGIEYDLEPVGRPLQIIEPCSPSDNDTLGLPVIDMDSVGISRLPDFVHPGDVVVVPTRYALAFLAKLPRTDIHVVTPFLGDFDGEILECDGFMQVHVADGVDG